MGIKEKLSLEKSGEQVIRLYKEGIFYIAYNHSAIRFRHFVNAGIKILRHELKNGSWYLRLGVVQTSSILANLPIKDAEGKYVDYLEVDCAVIETSLNEVTDCIIKKSVATTGKQPKEDNAPVSTNSEKKVIEIIKNLNLGTLTPVQAITMISEWQEMLK